MEEAAGWEDYLRRRVKVGISGQRKTIVGSEMSSGFRLPIVAAVFFGLLPLAAKADYQTFTLRGETFRFDIPADYLKSSVADDAVTFEDPGNKSSAIGFYINPKD
jgi:hypothetical protein